MGLLYVVCCLPIQIFRLSPKQRVNGCEMALNILICASALFRLAYVGLGINIHYGNKPIRPRGRLSAQLFLCLIAFWSLSILYWYYPPWYIDRWRASVWNHEIMNNFCSVLSPALHVAYVSSSGRSGDELISTSKDSEVALNVMNDFGERNTDKDEEKAVWSLTTELCSPLCNEGREVGYHFSGRKLCWLMKSR